MLHASNHRTRWKPLPSSVMHRGWLGVLENGRQATAQCCDSVTCRLAAAWHEVGIGLHACTRAEVWLNLHFPGASCVLAEKVEALKIVSLVFCLQVMQDNNAREWVR